MFEIAVEHSFAAGHYLREYRGKCENPHGHNYRVRITLAGEQLDKAGLLLDFGDLKKAMLEVAGRLDHKMINEVEPFVRVNPSAENIARYFYTEIQQQLKAATAARAQVKEVTVWETDSTTATYRE